MKSSKRSLTIFGLTVLGLALFAALLVTGHTKLLAAFGAGLAGAALLAVGATAAVLVVARTSELRRSQRNAAYITMAATAVCLVTFILWATGLLAAAAMVVSAVVIVTVTVSLAAASLVQDC